MKSEKKATSPSFWLTGQASKRFKNVWNTLRLFIRSLIGHLELKVDTKGIKRSLSELHLHKLQHDSQKALKTIQMHLTCSLVDLKAKDKKHEYSWEGGVSIFHMFIHLESKWYFKVLLISMEYFPIVGIMGKMSMVEKYRFIALVSHSLSKWPYFTHASYIIVVDSSDQWCRNVNWKNGRIKEDKKPFEWFNVDPFTFNLCLLLQSMPKMFLNYPCYLQKH